MPFTPLRVRSHGSLLAGVSSPEALIERALELGHRALALTDRDNLYLIVRFLKAAAAAGLRALPGAELTHAKASVLLLAYDRRGWANLCALLTARRLDPAFDLVRTVGELHAGLHVICESPNLAIALLAAGVPPAVSAADERARPLPHRGGLWLGVRGLSRERAMLRERLATAWTLGVPAVATGDVLMRDPGDHDTHRVAVTAAAGELLERMPPASFGAREAWLASPAEWERRIRALCGGAGCPEAAEILLANNAAIAARGGATIEMGTPIFPRAPRDDGADPADANWAAAQLATLAREGLARRYPARGPARRAAEARLADELGLIAHMGFTDYFLMVANIVGFARARGIPTVGRGSGAASIVSYLLGVTNVDPVRYGLRFERFLHPRRRDCPDLDVDLCWRRRDEVIAHVYDTYGHDRVAMISTHATLGPRAAFREAAKVLGVPLPRVNALARRVPRGELPDPSALEKTLQSSDLADFREPRIAQALTLAAALAGAPRHLSVHCGGLVIADRALTHYLPLERAAKGVVVSQFEMRAVEAIGLVKMDLLGNRALTTIGECLELASGTGGASDGAPLTPDTIPDEDPLTADVLAVGDTLNTFQLESPAMRHLLRMLDCRSLDDTIAAVALVRPGPAESGMKEAFCRRRRGIEPVSFPHARLAETLADTHGILLYEEDVMRVANALVGLPFAEGETLRRAIAAARDEEEFRFLEHGFLAQAARAGITKADAHRVWCELARFGAYAFCKAHAAGYGRLGWQSAYLKLRWPAAWTVGVLHSHAGMYPTWVHVEDLRRGGTHRPGVTVLGPCAMRSGWESRLEPDARPAAIRAREGTVRVGLHRVTGLSEATGARLVAARSERAFASFADLVDRVRPTPPELESLVLAGACDALPGEVPWAPRRTRASMLLEARVGVAIASRDGRSGRGARASLGTPALGANGTPLVPAAIAPRPGGETLPELPELPLADRVRGEFAATGMWFAAHPLAALAPDVARRGTVPAASIGDSPGRRVAVCGIPCASRRVEAKGGGHVMFVTLADESGLAECVLFPQVFARFHREARGEIVRIEGRVDDALGALTLVAERVHGFGAGEAHEPGAPSRNRPEAPGARVPESGPPSRYREGGAVGERASAAGR